MYPSPENTDLRPPLISVALVSATSLAYETLLVRLFSIVQWHHFAFMVISLALLGYGISGTLLAFFQQTMSRHFERYYLGNLLLYPLTMIGCTLLAQGLNFNPEEILWDAGQWWRLLLVYLLLGLPFVFVANAIGLALMKYPDQLARVYGADLVGAGLGALSIIGLLFLVFPLTGLEILVLFGVLATAIAQWELNAIKARWMTAGVILVAGLLALPDSWMQPAMSPYKGLNQTLRIPGTEVVSQSSSPLGMISVVESPRVPLRQAPGLSLASGLEPPPQIGIFIDGEGPAVINRVIAGDSKLEYLRHGTAALPYALKTPDRVLVLGAGSGTEVLRARYHGAKKIDAVELNPVLTELVKSRYENFSGNLYQQPGIEVHEAEARGFVKQNVNKYDLIQLALLDSFSAGSAGLYALREDYLYTVEAMQDYMARLSTNGVLSINRWVRMPPRDTLKLFATAVSALKANGVKQPGLQLALMRDWQTSTLLVKQQPFNDAELQAIRNFAASHSFDLAWLPGIKEDEVNQYNSLRQPLFYQGAKALLGDESKDYIKSYKYHLQPATDDQPYFYRFFRWQTLPELLSLRGQGGTALLDVGYLVLLATISQAILASLLLILLPILLAKRMRRSKDLNVSRWRVFSYFGALGIAFLFLEIAFIQKLIQFLHHPIYAVAVVLTSFLVFAGLGSLHTQRYCKNDDGIRRTVISIVLLSFAYLLALDPLFDVLAKLDDTWRIVVSVILIAPLAFFMGMPFPRGLSSLGRHAPAFIPWAWGINGCISVISAAAATLLAVHFGFSWVVILAVLAYAGAAASFPARRV